mmetsp:Transcript_31662/g.71186  ORF Transcript_31662/g.71186 Transcript_31662/m.71186 type:complete len:188 (-) Transcript_31662:209-772(-)
MFFFFFFFLLFFRVRALKEFYNLMAMGASRTAPHTVKDIGFPISLRNERAAMAVLLEMVDQKLASYPTSLAEDRAALTDKANAPPFSNTRHALIQVAGEKEVLAHYRQHALVALEMLGLPVGEDATYQAKLRELEVKGTSKWILKYVSDDPRAPLGVCRRLERRKLQHTNLAGGQHTGCEGGGLGRR